MKIIWPNYIIDRAGRLLWALDARDSRARIPGECVNLRSISAMIAGGAACAASGATKRPERARPTASKQPVAPQA